MSMRIVPDQTHSSSFTSAPKTASAPAAPGIHDTLRHGVGPSPYTSSAAAQPPTSRHPLEARLRAWESTQESLRMEALRKTYGMAEPIRRGMELKIAREGEWRPMALQGAGNGRASGVHEDVLRGREAFMDWDDVFTGEDQKAAVGVHDEMERKLKI